MSFLRNILPFHLQIFLLFSCERFETKSNAHKSGNPHYFHHNESETCRIVNSNNCEQTITCYQHTSLAWLGKPSRARCMPQAQTLSRFYQRYNDNSNRVAVRSNIFHMYVCWGDTQEISLNAWKHRHSGWIYDFSYSVGIENFETLFRVLKMNKTNTFISLSRILHQGCWACRKVFKTLVPRRA